MAKINIDQQLNQYIQDRIFIEAQNPHLAFVSHSFYLSSRTPSIQASYLIKKYGRSRVWKKLLKRKHLTDQLTEETALALVSKGAQLSSIGATIFSITKIHKWESAIKAILSEYNLIKAEKQARDPKTGQNLFLTQYTAEPVFDTSRVYGLSPRLRNTRYIVYNRNSLQKREDFNFLQQAKIIRHIMAIRVDLQAIGIPINMIVGGKTDSLLHRKIFDSEDLRKKIIVIIIFAGETDLFINIFEEYHFGKKSIQDFVEAAICAKRAEILDLILAKHRSRINFDFLIYNNSLLLYSGHSCLSKINLDCFKVLAKHNIETWRFEKKLLLYAYSNLGTELIEHLSDKITFTKDDLNSFLLEASKRQHVGLIQSLLDKGADAAYNGFAPVGNFLQYYKSHDGIEKALSAFRLELNKTIGLSDLGNQLRPGYLDFNSYIYDRIEQLLKLGFDVNYANGRLLKSAFGWRKINLSLLKLLIKHNVNLNISNGDCISTLLNYNSPEAQKLFLENGADFRFFSGPDFKRACNSRFLPPIKAILESANPNPSDIFYELLYTCLYGCSSVAEAILENCDKFPAVLQACTSRIHKWIMHDYFELEEVRGLHIGCKKKDFFQKFQTIDNMAIDKTEISRNDLKQSEININNRELLLAGCKIGSLNVVKRIIESGSIDVHKADSSYIDCANRFDGIDVVKYLFSQGSKINCKSSELFINACEYKIEGLVKKMLSSGYKNKQVINQMLVDASKHKDKSIFNLLLQHGDINALSGDIIINACKTGNTEFVKQLLSLGANIISRNNEGFVLACKLGYYDIAKLAIENGAHVDANGSEALVEVCLKKNKKMSNLLIQSGADLSITSNCDFVSACEKGDLNHVKQFIDSGKVDIGYNNNLGLIRACINDQLDVVKALVKNGVELNARNGRPLDIAYHRGYYEIARFLAKNGAVVNPRMVIGL